MKMFESCNSLRGRFPEKTINNGNAYTNIRNVSLQIYGNDPFPASKMKFMSFSNTNNAE